WTEVQGGARDLAGQIRRRFLPEVIFVPSPRGAIIAHLMVETFTRPVPIIAGVFEWLDGSPTLHRLHDLGFVATKKSSVQVPNVLRQCRHQRLLIVDDVVIGGDAMDALRSYIVDLGFDANHVKTATLVATEVAIQNKKAPDFYWKTTESPQF